MNSFGLRLKLRSSILWQDQEIDREAFLGLLWSWFGGQTDGKGLLGLHEGTVLTEEAHEGGQETESWVIDSAQAPKERDWISKTDSVLAELYFGSEEVAREAEVLLQEKAQSGIDQIEFFVQEPKDWNEDWKKSFNANENGFKLAPFWRILPSWVERAPLDLGSNEIILRINPGAGFGTGTHETTQLCLESLGLFKGFNEVLDFGSGSGILAVAAAILGGKVDAVEIDELAIENAIHNAEINRVRENISYQKTLDELKFKKKYSVVLANILKPVLLEFSDRLIERLEPSGVLILSGLVEGDVEEVSARYLSLLQKRNPKMIAQLRSKNEWRCLVFSEKGKFV